MEKFLLGDPREPAPGFHRGHMKKTFKTPSLHHSSSPSYCPTFFFSAQIMHLSTSFYGLKSFYQKTRAISEHGSGSELHAKEATTGVQ